AGKILIVEDFKDANKMLTDRGVEVIGTTTQARNALITLGIPADSITILPGEARSTMDEVIVTRDYLLHHPEIESLIVVSSPSHMRRARMIFRAALKNAKMPVSVWCSPSAYTSFNAEKWWKNKEDIQIVLSEYLKITSFVLFEKRTLKKLSD
ncbi:MAG: YdcF family protein, partial [Bacteroidales bacterium]|nr:YdcF family protein [Bacteroidales bacterium]